MATIYLQLSKRADTTQQKEIRLRFKHGKIDQQAQTGIFINPDYWDEQAEGITIPNFRFKTEEKKRLIEYLNEQSGRLSDLKKKIQSLFNQTDKNSIASDWLKQTIDKINFPALHEQKAAEPETPTVFRFIDKFICETPDRKDKTTGRSLSYNIIQQYKATQKHLIDFGRSIGKADFDFSNIDPSFYEAFVAYLQRKGFTQNSVGKHIKVLKTMLNEATAQGFNSYTKYNDFHVFTEETDTIYLNEKELQQLKEADLSTVPHLDRVRDWFLLLAWTGCRFSDLGKVVQTDIKDGFISFRQQKTNAKVVIPLHPVVLEILEKYNFNLPAEISNQRFNVYIKEVCRIAGIDDVETLTRTVGGVLVTEKFQKWEQVSSHSGRRSFCTNMYKRGLPTLMIMSISGHKTEKAFLKYIKVKQHEHAAMMKAAWENIYK